MSLLETNQSRHVTLWPFLVKYVEDSIDRSDRDEFMMVLCHHFGLLVHKVYLIYHEITNENTFGSNYNTNGNKASQCGSFMTDLGSQMNYKTNDVLKLSAMVRQMKE